MEAIPLVGCVIPDEQQRVLLVHRIDHNQWQLPGGRIQSEDCETPEMAAHREGSIELGLDVQRTRRLGHTTFTQGIVIYDCKWLLVTRYEGHPFLQQPDIYDDFQFHNLFRYNVGRIGLSQNVANLAHALQNEDVRL